MSEPDNLNNNINFDNSYDLQTNNLKQNILEEKNTSIIDLTKKYFSGFVGVKWIAMIYVSIIQVIFGIVI
jgi:hypothetical protein